MTSELHSMATPRDPLEIEGCLLPPDIPIATAVTDGATSQTTTTAAVAAVALTHFDYNTTEVEYLPAADAEEYQDIPTAPFLPSYDDDQSREHREALAVAKGKQTGRIAAEQERVDIERNNREIKAIQWHTKEAMKEANREAKRQDAEGVQIMQDKLTAVTDRAKEDDDSKQEPKVGYSGSGGYEISDYETTEYSGYEYETSEYKSVYDS